MTKIFMHSQFLIKTIFLLYFNQKQTTCRFLKFTLNIYIIIFYPLYNLKNILNLFDLFISIRDLDIIIFYNDFKYIKMRSVKKLKIKWKVSHKYLLLELKKIIYRKFTVIFCVHLKFKFWWNWIFTQKTIYHQMIFLFNCN